MSAASTFKRASKSAKKIALYRLPDGTFAPKGTGQVLKPGDKVTVPHKKDGSQVTGTVGAKPPGAMKDTVTVTLSSGPDKGQPFVVSAKPKAGMASPGTTGGQTPKLKTAWAAFDKKMAQFKALGPDADKKEKAKLASQVRAAKWAIKRAGGDPSKRPEWAKPGAIKPNEPVAAVDVPTKVPDPSPEEIAKADLKGENAFKPKPKTKAKPKSKIKTESGESLEDQLKKSLADAESKKAGNTGFSDEFTPEVVADALKAKFGDADANITSTGGGIDGVEVKPGKAEGVDYFLATTESQGVDIGAYDADGQQLWWHTAKSPEAAAEFVGLVRDGNSVEVGSDGEGKVVTKGGSGSLIGNDAMNDAPAKPKTKGYEADAKAQEDVALEKAKAKQAKKAAPKSSGKSVEGDPNGEGDGSGFFDADEAVDKAIATGKQQIMTFALDLLHKNDPDDKKFAAQKQKLIKAIRGEDDPDVKGQAEEDSETADDDPALDPNSPSYNPDKAEAMADMDAEAEADAAPAASPDQAALDAYKAAGGNDPTVIAILSAKVQASQGGVQQGAPVAATLGAPSPAGGEAPGGLVPNKEGIDLDHMVPGQVFAMNDGTEVVYYKPAGGAFHLVKKADGSLFPDGKKAKPYHGKMQPPKVGPAPNAGETFAVAQDAPVTPEPSDDDLFGKLQKSVELGKAGKLPAQQKKTFAASNEDMKPPEKGGPLGPIGADVARTPGQQADKDTADLWKDVQNYGGIANVPGMKPGAETSTDDHVGETSPTGFDLADSPGRGPTGKLRNFKAMGKPKLAGVIADLKAFGGDPEALAAAEAAYALK